MTKKLTKPDIKLNEHYDSVLGDISDVVDAARRSAVRSVSCIMTAAYWLIAQRIVEFEQKGQIRAEYGVKLLERLAKDLNTRFGRGFSYPNLNRFRQFYLTFPLRNNLSTLLIESGQPILSTLSIESNQHVKSFLDTASKRFSLPWSAYIRLLSVKNENARRFHETEALRGGWSVRQLNRQISSQFYERTALSRNKAAMLRKGKYLRPKIWSVPMKRSKTLISWSFSDSRMNIPKPTWRKHL